MARRRSGTVGRAAGGEVSAPRSERGASVVLRVPGARAASDPVSLARVKIGHPGLRSVAGFTNRGQRMTMSKMNSKLVLAGALAACAFGGIALGTAWVTPASSTEASTPA